MDKRMMLKVMVACLALGMCSTICVAGEVHNKMQSIIIKKAKHAQESERTSKADSFNDYKNGNLKSMPMPTTLTTTSTLTSTKCQHGLEQQPP